MNQESELKKKIRLGESFSIQGLRYLIDENGGRKSNQVLINEIVIFADIEAKAAIKYFNQTNKNPYITSQQ